MFDGFFLCELKVIKSIITLFLNSNQILDNVNFMCLLLLTANKMTEFIGDIY